MLADPRHRQIGEDLLLVRQPLELNGRTGGRDQVVEAEDDPLRPPGGARGVKDDRRVGAPAAGNLGSEELGALAQQGAARLAHNVIGMEVGLRVMAQPARVAEDHGIEQLAALLDQDQLVDLLLVLDDRKAHLGVVEDEGHLLGDRILVDRHRDAAQRLRRGDRPIEARAVVADDRELVAAREPERREPAGQRFDFGGDLGPAPALPDAVILLAHRRPVGAQPGMRHQHLGKGVQGIGIRCCGNTTRHPAFPGRRGAFRPPGRPPGR